VPSRAGTTSSSSFFAAERGRGLDVQHVATARHSFFPPLIAREVHGDHVKVGQTSFASFAEVRLKNVHDLLGATGRACGSSHEVTGLEELQNAVLRNETGGAGDEHSISHGTPLSVLR
jgi:hypothetical protein